MPSREFTDSEGRRWRAWTTTPEKPRGIVADLAAGWLSFECGECLRRLVPIPQGWESCSLEQLELLCRAASDVQRRIGPFTPHVPMPAITPPPPADDPPPSKRA